MIKRISLIIFSIVLLILVAQFAHHNVFAVASNPTTTTSTSTFTIRGGNLNDTYDQNGNKILKPNQSNGYNVITLDASLNGRTAELPVGSRIFLHFPAGKHNVTINPVKGVVETPQGIYHFPNGNIKILTVVGQGTATITVTETKVSRNGKVTNAASTSQNWSGYARTTGGTYTDITSSWTVPTAQASTSATYSSAWIGIDGATNSNLIQTGTESDYVSGSASYNAWWEILPAAETVLSTTTYPVSPGDAMFAEIKKNATNWTINIQDLTKAWSFSTNQTYSGQQSSTEWILEAPTVGGSQSTLANYGSTSFLNDTQNGGNPSHSYSTDSIDMTDSNSNVISSTSQPNSTTNGFSVAYGSTAPSAPTGSWTNEGDISTGIYGQTATLLNNGKVVIAGGVTSSNPGNPTSNAYRYTPCTMPCSSGSWLSISNMNHTHEFHLMAHVAASGGTEKVLVAGGWQYACGCVQKKAELYDPSANTWTDTPDMNQAREKTGSSLLIDGTVLVTGGDSNTYIQASASSEIYDPVANTWTTKASMSTARTQQQQVTFTDSGGNSKVMVMGGANSSGSLKSTEIYNPSTNSWSAGPSMAYNRGLFAAVLLHDGRILVVGGDNINNSEVYDPSTNAWSTYTTPYKVGAYTQAVLLGSGAGYKVLVASPYGTSNQAMLFDPSTNSWTVKANMNTARSVFSLTGLSDGNVLAAGGNGSSTNYLKASEVYTP